MFLYKPCITSYHADHFWRKYTDLLRVCVCAVGGSSPKNPAVRIFQKKRLQCKHFHIYEWLRLTSEKWAASKMNLRSRSHMKISWSLPWWKFVIESTQSRVLANSSSKISSPNLSKADKSKRELLRK